MNNALLNVLQQGSVWCGEHWLQTPQAGLASGFAALDAVLPAQGWPRGAVTEILHNQEGIGELALLMPALAAQTQQAHYVILINPPYWVYAPAWAAQEVQLSYCLVVRPGNLRDVLWAAEQSLRAGASSLVVIWPEFSGQGPDYKQLQRLQAAAVGGQTAGVLFRSATAALNASPAPLRLQLTVDHDQLAVRILKRRGAPVAAPVTLAPRCLTRR